MPYKHPETGQFISREEYEKLTIQHIGIIAEYRPHYITGTCHAPTVTRELRNFGEIVRFNLWYAEDDALENHTPVLESQAGDKQIEWDDFDIRDRRDGVGMRPLARIEAIIKLRDGGVTEERLHKMAKMMRKQARDKAIAARRFEVSFFAVDDPALVGDPQRDPAMQPVVDGTRV